MIFTVIWVLADNSQNNTKIFVPVSTVMKKMTGSHFYSSLNVEIETWYDPTLMKTYITNELLKYLKISNSDDATFSVSSMSEILSSITQVTWTLTILLAWIAAISLIVWGIWVMNIMLVSVTERTKEIWIRKAVWATRYDILAQFLIEALIISIVAWIIGILLSFSVVAIIKNFTSAVITMNSIYLSFFAVVSIWIIFWILPARKAANLKPIDALRFE
jgi:putative ABC transport system permease protein